MIQVQCAGVLVVDNVHRCRADAKEVVLCGLILREKVMFVVHSDSVGDYFVSDVEVLNLLTLLLLQTQIFFCETQQVTPNVYACFFVHATKVLAKTKFTFYAVLLLT